jgi:hypothetical protein
MSGVYHCEHGAQNQRARHEGAAPFAFSKGAGVRPIRHPLVRYYGRRELHFVTFSCHRRKPWDDSV